MCKVKTAVISFFSFKVIAEILGTEFLEAQFSHYELFSIFIVCKGIKQIF